MVDKKTAVSINPGQEIALCENGRILAVLEVTDKFNINTQKDTTLLHQNNHPYPQQTTPQHNIAIGGNIWGIDTPTSTHSYHNLQFTPAQTRRMFARRGWHRIVGYHPTTPLYRTQEYIQKTALALVDGLFILHTLNPQITTATTSLLTYQTILKEYFPSQNVLLSIYSGFLHYSGPRQTLLWAQIHKNYGCTHFIVSQDSQQKNQHIFDNFTKDELGITIMPFDKTYFCTQCDMIVSSKTCPHNEHSTIHDPPHTAKTLFSVVKTPQTILMRPEVANLINKAKKEGST